MLRILCLDCFLFARQINTKLTTLILFSHTILSSLIDVCIYFSVCKYICTHTYFPNRNFNISLYMYERQPGSTRLLKTMHRFPDPYF